MPLSLSLKADHHHYHDYHHYFKLSLFIVVCATHQQGLYDKAEPLYIRALRVRQKIFGEIHADIAQSFNSRTCSAPPPHLRLGALTTS
jgi:hypothetical protein